MRHWGTLARTAAVFLAAGSASAWFVRGSGRATAEAAAEKPFPLPPRRARAAEMLFQADRLRQRGLMSAAARRYARLVRRWPQAPEAGPAQRALAECLEADRRWDAAFWAYDVLRQRYPESLTKEEVLDRQLTLARLVLGRRAHRWLLGGTRQPRKAIPLLETWLQYGGTTPRAAEALCLLGSALAEIGRVAPAADAFARAESLAPSEPWAEAAARGRARALARLARSVTDEDLWTSAREALERYEQRYPETAFAMEAARERQRLEDLARRRTERQRAAAFQQAPPGPSRFRFGRAKWRTPAEQLAFADALREAGRTSRALRHYAAVFKRWPSSPEAARAQYEYARALEQRGKADAAFEAYRRLVERFSGLFAHEQVLGRMFDLAQQVMTQRHARAFLGGYTAPERAVPLLEQVVAQGPGLPFAPQAQYFVGKVHEDLRQYEEAVQAYALAEQRYPDTPFGVKAAYGRARCLYLLAQESPYDDQASEMAWAALTLALQRYPDADEAPVAAHYRQGLFQRRARAAYDRALFYDKVARRPEAALTCYRQFLAQFPNSEWTALAQIRIQELTRKLERQHEQPPAEPAGAPDLGPEPEP